MFSPEKLIIGSVVALSTVYAVAQADDVVASDNQNILVIYKSETSFN